MPWQSLATSHRKDSIYRRYLLPTGRRRHHTAQRAPGSVRRLRVGRARAYADHPRRAARIHSPSADRRYGATSTPAITARDLKVHVQDANDDGFLESASEQPLTPSSVLLVAALFEALDLTIDLSRV